MGEERLRQLVEQHGLGGLLSRRILIVDDETPNLDVLAAVLDGADYTCLTATSGEEALGLALAEPIDLIVADQRMPGMTGVELLAAIRKHKPDVAGLVVTAYTDSPALIAMINQAGVFRLLTKPWRPEELLAALRQASEHVFQVRAIEGLVQRLAHSNEELRDALLALRATQEQLLHMERLSTIGRLTSGVVHDLRNLLTPLLYLAEELPLLPVPEPVRIGVAAGVAGTRNLVEMLTTLKQFARRGQLDLERAPASLPAIVREAQAVLASSRDLRQRRLDVRIPATLPPLLGDHRSLVQALVNLLNNAAEATPAGGRILIEVCVRPEGGVLVAVEDEGPGVPVDRQACLFTPFSTTKGEEGMGMGLYMARLVCEAHGGTIRYCPGEGGGARFELLL